MLLRRHRKTGQTKSSDLKPEKVTDYSEYTVPELKDEAKKREIEGYFEMKKAELIKALEK